MEKTKKLPEQKEPYELYTKIDGGEVKISHHACGICHIPYATYEIAKKCCMPYYCDTCGIQTKKYHLRCCDCSRKLKFEEAETITETSKLVADEDGDNFFGDIGEALDYYYDIFEADPESVPEYLFICEVDKWEGLDIEQALERSTDEYCVDGEPPTLKDVQELVDFVEKWNEKQNVEVYSPSYKQKINIIELLKKELTKDGE